MRAKFTVTKVMHTTWSEQAELVASHSGTPEDNQFSSATPAGRLDITITADDARGFLQPGKSYYLDVTPAPD